MKPQKHYIQVWIESEDDLPEVDGKYIVHNKNNGNIVRYHWYCNDNCASFWLQRVDWYFAEWYLISTKQPKGLTDAEEKLFILDLLKLNKFIKIDGKKFYPEESVINIIKQLLKTETCKQ